jgi:hypothetical protein
MSVSVRDFGRLLGAETVTAMAAKVGVDPTVRPVSVRTLILSFGLPLQPANLRISWLKGSFPQHPVDHPPDSREVPVRGSSLQWNDPGRESQRKATAWNLHLQFEGTAKDFAISALVPFSMDFDSDTFYSWSVIPANEFGQGPSSTTFTFHTESSTPPQPPVPPAKPTISVTKSGSGGGSVFVVDGFGFTPNADVRIRAVDDTLAERDFHQSTDGAGRLDARLAIPCISGLPLHFSATDGRPDPSDVTGVLFSNTVTTSCP